MNLDLHRLEEYPEDTDGIKLLFIGRIMKDKGIEELLDAASAVKKIYPNVQFHLLGGMEEDYADMIHDFEKQGVVQYHRVLIDIKGMLDRKEAEGRGYLYWRL